MRNKLTLAFILTGFLLVNAQTMNEDGIIARIGNDDISVKEFLYRYELTPQLFRENKNIKPELKKEFLYSLIAEKLLAQFARDSFIDTSKIVRETIKSYEEMFVRDALYKKEIGDKSIEKEDSLLDIYLSGPSKIFVIYLSSSNEKQADDLYNLLDSGAPFDSLYSELPDSSKDTLMLVRGQLGESGEEEVFNLQVNAFSHPVLINNTWFVVKLLSGSNPVLDKEQGWETEYKYLQKLSKTRAEHEFYKSYMLKFFDGINAKANAKLMKSLGKEIYKILLSKRIAYNSPQRIFLEPYDLLKIKKIIGSDTLSMTYIKLEDKQITLNKFIEFFRFEPFFVDTIDYRKVLGILNGKTKTFIEYQLLTEEGYRQGLQNSEEVRENLKRWTENYFSQLISSEFIDSVDVSDEDLKEYLNMIKRGKFSIKKVNIVELYTDSLEIAEQVLKKLDEGENLEDLVKLYSNKQDSEKIESGFFPVTSRGEIGQIADRMSIGDVYGPVSYENGYLIFKLIGVEEDSVMNFENKNKLDEDIRREIKFKKSYEALNKFIAKLANKYGFSFNEELLNQINVTSITSVLYDYLGFGGRILAVPLLTPNMEWVKVWENMQYNP